MINQRFNKLIACMPSDFQAAIITSNENKFYFLGVNTHDAGTLVVLPTQMYFIIDFRYIEVCKKNITNAKVILQEKLYEQINKLLNTHNVKEVYLEKTQTLEQYFLFKENLKAAVIPGIAFSTVIEQIRQIKDVSELEQIYKAQQITDKAYEYMLGQICVGKTEKQLKNQLDYFMLENGANSTAFDTIFLSGENTSLPHGIATDRKLKNGDFITMDFGAKVGGYCTDMTRTVALGNVTDEMEIVYNVVYMAQIEAIRQVKNGCKCSDIDAVARRIINRNRYGKYFGHATGHGVGLEIHEEPRFSAQDSNIAKANMVITVEPGIYIPNKFGVRIEDTVIVTENGCQIYGKTNKSLTIIK